MFTIYEFMVIIFIFGGAVF